MLHGRYSNAVDTTHSWQLIKDAVSVQQAAAAAVPVVMEIMLYSTGDQRRDDNNEGVSAADDIASHPLIASHRHHR